MKPDEESEFSPGLHPASYANHHNWILIRAQTGTDAFWGA